MPATADSTAEAPPRASAGTTLYLVRHGRTDYNRRGIVQGRRIDSVLDATGRRQAEALAARFAEVPLDALYASTMRRARQTAGPVAARHPAGLDVRTDEDLEEMSWGRLEGEPPTDAVRSALDDVKADWRRGHLDRAIEGGESARDVQRRALRAARRVLKAEAGGTVLVVAHGRLLRVLIASLLAADRQYGLANMHRVEHDNTGVNHLVYDDEGACSARLLNCTAHLDGVAEGAAS